MKALACLIEVNADALVERRLTRGAAAAHAWRKNSRGVGHLKQVGRLYRAQKDRHVSEIGGAQMMQVKKLKISQVNNRAG